MRKSTFLIPLCVCCFLASTVSLSLAQEPAAQEAQAGENMATVPLTPEEWNALFQMTEEEGAKLGAANSAFHEKFKEYKVILKDLKNLKLEYQQAKPARMEEIEKTYAEKVAQGMKIQPELTELVFKAFAEAPNKNPHVITHIFGLIDWEYNRENYEEAVRLFKELEKFGVPDPNKDIYAVAGLAAMKSMDFDSADKWLDVARKIVPDGETKTLLDLYLDVEPEDAKRTDQMLLHEMPNLKRNWAKEVEIRNREAAETDPEKMNPLVEIKTNKGNMVIELFEDDAPNTVASFIHLVEKGFYKNVIFHRVLPYFMAQGGDPTGKGNGGPNYTFDCECYKPDYRRHFRGSISMANAGPNTNGSQFFLTFVPTLSLDGRHTAFGRIVDGIEVLSDIQRIDPESEVQPEPDRILEAKVIRKRSHDYVPKINRGKL